MKEKVKIFFITYWKSILPQTEYYHKLFKTKFSYSLKYFFFLIFCLNLLFFIYTFFKYPLLEFQKIKHSFTNALSQYPVDLKIYIKSGVLTTNYNHPYFLWMDYQGKKILLAVVDETALPNKIAEYKSYVLLTNNNLVLNFPKAKIYSLSGLDLVIDRSWIQNQIAQADSIYILPIFVALFPFVVFLLPFFIAIVKLVYLIFLSLVVYVAIKLLKKKTFALKFKKIVQIALHASTLPLLIYFFLLAQNPTKVFNLWFPFLVLLFLAVAVYEACLGVKKHHK